MLNGTLRTIGVLYIANSAKIGGGNRVLMDLATGIHRDRFEPVIVTPEEGPLAAWARERHIEVHAIRDGDWSGRAGLLRRTASLTLMARARGISLVHAMAPTCYRAAGLAGQLLGIPRVCHLEYPPAPGELAFGFRSGPDAVITCYERQVHEVGETIRQLRPRCRVQAIPNATDTRLYAPAARPPNHPLRFGSRHVVLIVGHLSEVKGYPTFLRAAARIRATLGDCVFLALGGETTGTGWLARFRQMTADLGIADCVHFLGFRHDVPDVLRAADVIVLPSLEEGLPLAILEAMACGKPVVATPVGGVPEAVVDEVTGLLVPPGEAEQLAAAVVRLLMDRRLAERMGQAGRRRVEMHFSLQRLVAEVETLYDELTGISQCWKAS